MADDAACQARPLAAADVIRRGDRRRRPAIAQRALGGLSIAGIAAAVILTGAASGAPAPPAAAASGTTPGATTVTETTSSPAGDLTIAVKYQPEPHGKLRLLSV